MQCSAAASRGIEAIAEHFIATARRDFEMIALSYGQQFLRDGAEHLVIRVKGRVRCMLRQDLIRFPGRAYLSAVDRDGRNLRAIEIHQVSKRSKITALYAFMLLLL